MSGPWENTVVKCPLRAQVEAACPSGVLASASNMPKAKNCQPHTASDGLQKQKIATLSKYINIALHINKSSLLSFIYEM